MCYLLKIGNSHKYSDDKERFTTILKTKTPSRVSQVFSFKRRQTGRERGVCPLAGACDRGGQSGGGGCRTSLSTLGWGGARVKASAAASASRPPRGIPGRPCAQSSRSPARNAPPRSAPSRGRAALPLVPGDTRAMARAAGARAGAGAADETRAPDASRAPHFIHPRGQCERRVHC